MGWNLSCWTSEACCIAPIQNQPQFWAPRSQFLRPPAPVFLIGSPSMAPSESGSQMLSKSQALPGSRRLFDGNGIWGGGLLRSRRHNRSRLGNLVSAVVSELNATFSAEKGRGEFESGSSKVLAGGGGGFSDGATAPHPVGGLPSPSARRKQPPLIGNPSDPKCWAPRKSTHRIKCQGRKETRVRRTTARWMVNQRNAVCLRFKKRSRAGHHQVRNKH